MYDLDGRLTTLPEADMTLYRAAQRDLEHNRNIQALHLSNTSVIGAFGGELFCVSRALYERLVFIQFRSRRPTTGLTKRQLNESTIRYFFKAKRRRLEESNTETMISASTSSSQIDNERTKRNGTNGEEKGVVASTSTASSSKKDDEDNLNECYICLEKFVNNNKLR